jgi:hypothetical protein
MSVGVLELLVLRPSCLSVAIVAVLVWLLVDQPSIAVGVIRGIQLTNSFGYVRVSKIAAQTVLKEEKLGVFLSRPKLENT